MKIEFGEISVSPAKGRTSGGRPFFVLNKPFVVGIIWEDLYDENPWKMKIVVPNGFDTDFASTPWFLHRFFPPAGKYAPVAVLHDYLYRKAANCPRVLADAVFRVGMKQLGVGRIKRWIMWAAVRLFGWLSYQKR